MASTARPRLPSLADSTTPGALPAGRPFGNAKAGDQFWSATDRQGSTTTHVYPFELAASTPLFSGAIAGAGSLLSRAWCVRDGQGRLTEHP